MKNHKNRRLHLEGFSVELIGRTRTNIIHEEVPQTDAFTWRGLGVDLIDRTCRNPIYER